MAQAVNKNLEKALKKVGEKYVAEVRDQLKRDGQYSSGELANSIGFDIVDQELDITSARYGAAVDEGSSPSRRGFGKVSKRFVDDIMNWAMMKGIYPKEGPATEGNMRKMAYAIGRTIQRDGIIQEYGNSGSKVFSRVYDRLEDEIGKEILDAYEKDIKESLINKINKKKK